MCVQDAVKDEDLFSAYGGISVKIDRPGMPEIPDLVVRGRLIVEAKHTAHMICSSLCV